MEINVTKLQIHPSGVFVAYEWEWSEYSEGAASSQASMTMSPASSPEKSDQSEPSDDTAADVCDIPEITHIVTFKCIGATRDVQQQYTLQDAKKLITAGNVINVKLQPEPHNPYDCKAIAFVCSVKGEWRRIGYVVREALEDVHFALNNNLILWTKFAWIKYLLSFPNSGPGFYAGIDIARSGDWSPRTVASSSK